MAIKLVVTNPFKSFQIGDEITDPAQVTEFLDTHPAHVVKVAASDPAPVAPSRPADPAPSAPSA